LKVDRFFSESKRRIISSSLSRKLDRMNEFRKRVGRKGMIIPIEGFLAIFKTSLNYELNFVNSTNNV